MEFQEKPLPEGEVVTCTSVGGGIVGRIVGIALTPNAIVGRLYIVQIIHSSFDKNIYPYSCIAIPEVMLYLADKEMYPDVGGKLEK